MGLARHDWVPRPECCPVGRVRVDSDPRRATPSTAAGDSERRALRRVPGPGIQRRHHDRLAALPDIPLPNSDGYEPAAIRPGQRHPHSRHDAPRPGLHEDDERLRPPPIKITGPLFAAAGMLYLSEITPEGGYVSAILPALILLSIGLAMLMVTVQNLALTGIEPRDAGVASAVVTSAFNIGGSIGLAVFTVIYARTFEQSLRHGESPIAAYTNGYAATFFASAAVMIATSLVAALLIRGKRDDLMPHYGQ